MNKIVIIVLYFIVGRAIFTFLSSVHYVANCMLPIGLLCAFFIEKEETLESYAYHLGIVYILSIVSVVVLWGWCKICKGFSVYVLALFCTCFMDSFTIL